MRLVIVGTGYVGLVTATCFAEMGNSVRCVDANPAIVEMLTKGIVPIYEPGLEEMVIRNQEAGRLAFGVSLADAMPNAEFVFLCVGTPPREDGSCDIHFVEEAARQVASFMNGPVLIVDKSTVPVGTADRIRDIVEDVLRERGVKYPFHVVSNPEFLKEGNALEDFIKPDRIIIGTDCPQAEAMMRELYAPFVRKREKIMVMDVRSAEMTKYASNAMLAAKISFINEVAAICEKVGANVRDVRMGMGANPRIGPHFLYPGLGYGGSCFPKDVKALIRTAQEAGVEPKLLEAVEGVNTRQKLLMALRVQEYFHPLGGVAGRTLAIWGLAFKANTDDMRESAALDIIAELTMHGMKIRAFDPQAGANARRLLAENKQVAIVDDAYTACDGADALLVATEWNQFRSPDFDRLKKLLASPVIFDGRNLYNPKFVISRGFTYFCVGRGQNVQGGFTSQVSAPLVQHPYN